MRVWDPFFAFFFLSKLKVFIIKWIMWLSTLIWLWSVFCPCYSLLRWMHVFSMDLSEKLRGAFSVCHLQRVVFCWRRIQHLRSPGISVLHSTGFCFLRKDGQYLIRGFQGLSMAHRSFLTKWGCWASWALTWEESYWAMLRTCLSHVFWIVLMNHTEAWCLRLLWSPLPGSPLTGRWSGSFGKKPRSPFALPKLFS